MILYFNSIFQSIFKLYFYIGFGIFIGYIFASKQNKISKIGSFLVINIFTPLVVFLTFICSNFSLDFISVFKIIILNILSIAIGLLTTYFLLKNKIQNTKKIGAYMFLNSFPNVLIYGIPIVTAIFDERMVIILTIFSASALGVRGTIGIYIGEKFGANIKLNFKESIKKLLLFPPFLGIIAGVIFMNIEFDRDIFILINKYSNPIYSALGAILIGLILASLKKQEIKAYLKDIVIVSIWRFIVPLLLFIVCLFFLHFPEFQKEIRTTLLISMLGPPAVINVSFAIYFGLDEKFAAISVATITLIALMILPIIIIFGVRFL